LHFYVINSTLLDPGKLFEPMYQSVCVKMISPTKTNEISPWWLTSQISKRLHWGFGCFNGFEWYKKPHAVWLRDNERIIGIEIRTICEFM